MPGRPGLSRQSLIVLKPHLLAERAELAVGAVEAVMISQFGTVLRWDPDFRDPNECLHDEIPSLVAAVLWPEPTTNASVSPTTRATVVFPRTTGKKSAKVGAVLLARARPSHEALALRVDAGP